MTEMDLKRTATIVVVGGACAAWLAAATTSGIRDSAARPVVDVPPPDVRAEDLAREIARLHGYLRPDAAPRPHGRNPFQFAAERPRQALLTPKAALTEAAAAPLQIRPQLKLSGMAEDAGPDGPVRTAIISGIGQLFLVKEGENVTSRYRVTKIGADVVELRDSTDGAIVRLALK